MEKTKVDKTLEVIRNAEKEAKQLIEDAHNESTDIISKAKKKADEIKNAERQKMILSSSSDMSVLDTEMKKIWFKIMKEAEKTAKHFETKSKENEKDSIALLLHKIDDEICSRN